MLATLTVTKPIQSSLRSVAGTLQWRLHPNRSH
jgi:hypothetical protein